MNLKILIVEDDDTTAKMFSKVLREAYGAKIYNVADNNSAMEIIRKYKPDLITTDINHLGGSGIELFDKIRRSLIFNSIPVIVVSGNFTSEQELYLYRQGINGIVRKPFNLEKLIVCINKIFHIKENTDVKLLHLGFESKDLDYKDMISIEDKGSRASLAKDVIAMANSGGGTIIIGVKEETPGIFKLIGVPRSSLNLYETTRINNAIKKYIGSVIAVTVKKLLWRGKSYISLKVPSVVGTLAMACCDNEQARLYQGRIYIRTDAARSEEVQDSFEVSRIIERIVDERIRSEKPY